MGKEKARMTTEQLAELRKMTAGEIARKYTPMLIRGQIKREQYDWLMSQGIKEKPLEAKNKTQENESNESVDTVSQFTTHESQEDGRTQKQKLEDFLEDGCWKSTIEIRDHVYGGDHLSMARIAARVYDLKQDGYEIESRKKQGNIWEYRKVRGGQGSLV